MVTFSGNTSIPVKMITNPRRGACRLCENGEYPIHPSYKDEGENSSSSSHRVLKTPKPVKKNITVR